MLIIKTAKELNNQLVKAKQNGKIIGFAPTMGALHAGHLSLIGKSKKETDITICSIFVNPTQFNDAADFKKYPNTIEKDIEMLAAAKCDILFLPSVKEMYPGGTGNEGKINFGFLAETLEGEFRPGHFDGMAQIVELLLSAVKPDLLYMGQKDFQQAMIVKELIKHRKMKTKLVVCAIKREKNGLAMSSRNVRLNEKDRETAAILFKTLKKIRAEIKKGSAANSAEAEKIALNHLEKFVQLKPEYFAWRKADSLKPIKTFNPDEETVLLIAAWIGGVRLIDNLLVGQR